MPVGVVPRSLPACLVPIAYLHDSSIPVVNDNVMAVLAYVGCSGIVPGCPIRPKSPVADTQSFEGSLNELLDALGRPAPLAELFRDLGLELNGRVLADHPCP